MREVIFCIENINAEFCCQRNQSEFNFYVTDFDTENDVAFFQESFARPTVSFCSI